MLKPTFKLALLSALAFVAFSCEDDNERANLRPSIDYSTLDPHAEYSSQFVATNGISTVNLTEGNSTHKMFQALNYYMSSSVSGNTAIDAALLDKLFTNTGDPFVDITTSSISIIGTDLNATDYKLRDLVASSKSASEAEAIRAEIESHFDDIATASASISSTAAAGQAGKLDRYLLDAKGIETAQIIQKSLIGALQLDYINVLLQEGLTADNYTLVGDANYTQLEHNWDVAYSILTLNQIYLDSATAENRKSIEFGLGSYTWEYNKENFDQIYPAFLKGRAAIVNNDRATLEEQALFLRTEFEKVIARAALGYLEKWKTGQSDAARAHAIGEGLGFIYSLRFASVTEVSAEFSDGLIEDLVGSENGFWDLDVTKINAASNAIKTKFNL